jgi:ATP-binding cassette subfamily F protein 3
MQVSNLSKRYGEALLFDKASFVINIGERVGLVGPNGCGKTTLLRLLMGEERPDSGSVDLTAPPDRVGYLPQALDYAPGMSVEDALRHSRDLDESHWADEVERLGVQIALATSDLPLLESAYATALERLAYAARFAAAHRLEEVLAGLGLDRVERSTPVDILSGGQKTRLSLARILLRHPVFLILDEPTNHLDIDALEWLEAYLADYDGGILLVSHDRAFLDRTVTRILEIDPQTHAVRDYAGNYSDYVEAKERARDRMWQTYQDQQIRIGRLQEAVRQLKNQASHIEQETVHFHYRKKAKKIAHNAVIRQKRIQRMIESEDHLDKPVQGWEMHLGFAQAPASGQDVLMLEGLSKRFDDLTLFEDVNLTLRQGERVALTGPNGSGKTTLLRIITGQELPSEGTARLGSNVRLGYFSQEQDHLDWRQTPLEAVQRAASSGETEARTFLHRFLFGGDEVFTPIGSLSFGERSRLTLATLVLQGCNLLLLDEPINHLDIPSREQFERALTSFDGTVLAVVHDRYFVARFATAIWAIVGGAVRRFADLADARRAQAAL